MVDEKRLSTFPSSICGIELKPMCCVSCCCCFCCICHM